MIYDIFLLIAKYLQDSGIDCILDATFNQEKSRNQVKRLHHLSDNQFHKVECACPEEVVFSRLRARKGDYSDADIRVYKKMKKIFEPVNTPHIVVDTRKPSKENAKVVMQKISGSI